jgi:drug/metabolite transporter (DMT)-like permease
MKGRGLGLLLATASTVAWSTNYLVGRYLASGGVDPLALSVARFALATPVIFALARLPRYRGGLALLAALGLLGVAGFNIFLYSSLVHISAAAASLFVVLASPTTQLLQAMLHREAPSRGALLGSAASFAGAYLILEPYITIKSLLGPALAILATLSWSLYTVLVRRVYALYTPAEAMAWISLFGTLAMSPLAAYADNHTLLTPTYAALVLYVALVPGAVAYTAWNTAVKLADPQSAASLLPLMPVITTALSAVLLHEGLTPLQTIGMALAIAGVYTALRVK